MFTLRPHQIRDLQRLRETLREHRCVLLVAPCGYGKGHVTTFVIDGVVRRGKHVLFLVHGRDRVNDMNERVTALGIAHGVVMGSARRESAHHVQIASVDTVYRMPLQARPKADLIVIDECHLAMSPTFRAVLDGYPEAQIIGLTATPMLGNGRALGVKAGGVFEAMVVGPTAKELISEGYLVKSRVLCPPAPEGIASLKKKHGEFDQGQGGAICDNAKVIGDIVAHWKRYASDRKTVSFGFHQAHAFHIAEQFREAGVNFAYIDSATKDGDIHTPGTRKFLWHQYDHGDLVGISSCQTISIGWDHPVCKNLILASKTGSFPLYHQRLGRGSRPYRDYKEFTVHDHCGNFWEHLERGPYFESDIEWQLDGEAVRECNTELAPAITMCKRPMQVPITGVPPGFTGPVSDDGRLMLPCYFTFETGPLYCPQCGLPLERPEAREIETAEGELQSPDEIAAKLGAESGRKARFLELVRIAATSRRKDGTPYKQGWPAIVYKAEFFCWPSRAWTADADRIRLAAQAAREREEEYA